MVASNGHAVTHAPTQYGLLGVTELNEGGVLLVKHDLHAHHISVNAQANTCSQGKWHIKRVFSAVCFQFEEQNDVIQILPDKRARYTYKSNSATSAKG